MALIEFTPDHDFVLASSYSDFTNLWWAIKEGRDLTDFDRAVFALDRCEDEDIQVVVPWLMAGEINKDNVKILTLRSVHEGGPTTEPYSANKSMKPT